MRGLVASIVCAVSCLGTTAATAQSALANHPIVGAWTLNVARSQGANVRLVVSSSAPGQIDMQMMGLSARFRVDGATLPNLRRDGFVEAGKPSSMGRRGKGPGHGSPASTTTSCPQTNRA